ncbi:MAG: SAM-dependent chlorinase/fluorinase [Thiogranum sp.]|nr:SAM-dependent chlorinase/fluorinase [Thiogranum sp.]
MIAIFTDFGAQGPYLGQMHAVLHRDAPGVAVVDIFPDLPPFNVKASAFLLPAYSLCLPAGTVCLCVVDPGVGSARRALAAHIDECWYVGPDNGLFGPLLRRATRAEVFDITWRPEQLSESFHGRDLFAPVAARIARGQAVPGERLDPASLVVPDWPDELAEIVYIDIYGNAISGMRASKTARDSRFEVAGRPCQYRRVFADAQPGDVFWYENSNGLVEIAVAEGNAADMLGLEIGDSIRPGEPAAR